MSGNNKLCIFCKQQFELNHGNRRYHKHCAYQAKKKRSVNRYAKQNLLIDPYWLNEKILRELYCTYGPLQEYDPAFLNDKGFDFDKFKTERRANGVIQIFMHQHGFSIQKNQKIILCKR